MNELRTGLADYLVLRRSLGYKLARAGAVLEDFVGVVEAGGSTHIRTEVALSWALRAPNAESRWRADRLAMVRGLARYLHAIDGDHEVPPAGLIPGRRRQPAPFLYSDEQVADLMAASHRLRSPVQAATLEAVVGLLWATGLRVAEALRLDNSDLDHSEHALHVRESKGGRSRIVPVDESVTAALRRYQRVRDEAFAHPRCPSLFVSTEGRRWLGGNLGEAFKKVASMVDLGTTPAGRAPRLGDFRHSFAVSTLLAWHRDGRDANALLPVLSTYLGHVSPSSTYWYLSASPELLAAAAQRLGDLGEVRS